MGPKAHKKSELHGLENRNNLPVPQVRLPKKSYYFCGATNYELAILGMIIRQDGP